MAHYTLRVEFDTEMECPNEWGGWRLYSFCTKHSSYTHPDNLPSLKKELKYGLAFRLSYYEHSQCIWGLQGETPRCPWDNVVDAGMLIWTLPAKELHAKKLEERRVSARKFLEAYTTWANGHCLWFCLEANGEQVESCGGFYTEGDLIDCVKEFLKEGDTVEIDPSGIEVSLSKVNEYSVSS